MGDYFKKTAFSFKYGYYAAEWLRFLTNYPFLMSPWRYPNIFSLLLSELFYAFLRYFSEDNTLAGK